MIVGAPVRRRSGAYWAQTPQPPPGASLICRRCAHAADTRQPHQPCDDPGCTCQHRTPKEQQHPLVGRVLTSNDPQPPAGSLVRDDCGTVWVNDGYWPMCWVRPGAEVHDPEGWTKIAGNYGPVTVLKWGDEHVDQVMRQIAGQR